MSATSCEPRGVRPRLLGLLVVALASLLPTRALALDYYVDGVSGNDARDGRSAANAWRTIDHLESAATLRAGDNVYLRAGSDFDLSALGDAGLRLRASESGTAAMPITITRYGSGAAPILRNPTGTTDRRMISVEGSYVVIDGLELSNAHYAGIYIDGTVGHVTVRNCDIHHVGVGVVAFAPNLLITRNVFHDGTMVVNTMGGDDDYGANGIVLSGSNIEISYNRAERLVAPSYDFTVDGGFVELYDTTSDVSIHHNVVVDSEGFTEGGSGSGDTIARVSVAYNLAIDNNGFFALHNGGDGFAADFVDCSFTNNTIVETSGATIFWFSGVATAASFTFRNNVIASSAGRIFQRPGTLVHTHNVFPSGVTLGLTADSTDLVADPLFVNAAMRDMHLRAGSPAIDVGTTALFTTDLDGVPVPSGGGVDRGAYERAAPGLDAGVSMPDASVRADASVSRDAGVDAFAGIDATVREDAFVLVTDEDASTSGADAPIAVVEDASIGTNDAATTSNADAAMPRDAAPSEVGARDATTAEDAGASPVSSGCACRTTARGSEHLGWLVIAACVLGLRRRRR